MEEVIIHYFTTDNKLIDSHVHLQSIGKVTRHLVSDECANLPKSLQNLEITSHTLPVIYSTEVKVRCNHGYTLQGDDTLTCVRGEKFNFSNIPTCQIGKS